VTVANNLILSSSAVRRRCRHPHRGQRHDVRLNPNQPNGWYAVDIVNMIVGSMAFAGGGISLLDGARVGSSTTILHAAPRDRGQAFPTATQQTESTPQPAGIARAPPK
jgi:hypothetical protein